MGEAIFKKGVVIVIMLLLTIGFVIPATTGDISNIAAPVVISVSQIGDNTILNYKINDYKQKSVLIDEQEYSIISIKDEPNLLLAGNPDIPVICRSIIIPYQLKMELKIISSSYTDYYNVQIAPSKGNLLRCVNPDDVPYEFSEVYSQDSFYPKEIAILREPYIIRDFRGMVIEIYPIQYNPVTKVMRVYNEISVEVYPNGLDKINIIQRSSFPEKVDFDFKEIYSNQFINFGKLGRYDPVGEQGNLLIIAYDDFIDEMDPFVDWKIMQGLPTEMVAVTEIGDANAIKAYIADYYNANGLTFVLLVGDAQQVPSYNSGGSASDPSYTYVVGSDKYPDLFVGRFSAQNADQVNTQVERSIEYEKTPEIGGEWYHKGIGVGSSQGVGDDGEYDYQHIRNLRTLLMDYTYDEVDELYDGSQGEQDEPGNPTPAMVSEAVNSGRSIINYCGHGSPQSWGTSGYSSYDIESLVNDNMLPFVTNVACNNGQFDDYDPCFCEAWLRSTNNGEPAGAIVATGSTVSMSWSPPMSAQDEFVDLIVESYEDNIKHTFGGIHYNGLMRMNDDYGSGGMYETDYWTLFGDPSLTIRTDTPQEMTVIRDEEIDEEATSYEIFTDTENALCAISRDGVLLGSAYTDGSGYAIIEFNEPINGEEPVNFVITGYNKIPYIVEVPIITNEPPLTPVKPSGPTSAKQGTTLTFTTHTTDPESNPVYYMWDWGDGNQSSWLGSYPSGETISTNWIYAQPGAYSIKVKAKDTENDESDWSEPLTISITKTKNVQQVYYLPQYLQQNSLILSGYTSLIR